MPPIFGRNSVAPHPYDSAITDWLKSKDPDLQAIALNIMYDHRVSKDREQLLDAFCNHPCTGEELNQAILNYFYKAIRLTHSPQFASKSINGDNILIGPASNRPMVNNIREWIGTLWSKALVRQKPGLSIDISGLSDTTGSSFRIDKNTGLARIIDLNGLGDVFQTAKDNGMVEFERYPGNEVITEWLDANLGYTEAQTRRFISAVLKAINRHSRVSPWNPTWATLWEQFERYTSEEADRWLEVLGIHKDEPRRWLIVLKYKAGKNVTIAHPTQLDAGWWPYYFPSPPKAALGHPMNLGDYSPNSIMPSEIIHTQLKHTITHWDDAGRLCKVTSRATYKELPSQRKSHYQQLKSIYGEQNVEAWMPYGSQFESS